jgi:O-antigen/teichoic acid export membrane protein
MDVSQSSAKVFVAKFGSSILGFVAIAIFARQLGSQILGQFFLFQGLVYLISQAADFGFRSAIIKRISEGSERGSFASSSALTKLVPLTIVCAVVLAVAPYINRYVGIDIAILIIVAIFVREYAQLALHIVEAELRVGETAIIIFFRQLAWICVGYALLGWGQLGS